MFPFAPFMRRHSYRWLRSIRKLEFLRRDFRRGKRRLFFVSKQHRNLLRPSGFFLKRRFFE